MTLSSHSRRRGYSRAARLLFAFILLCTGALSGSVQLWPATPASAAPAGQTQASIADPQMFGIVMRDPFYEFNTDPTNYPNACNRTAMERQASELHALGATWVRMEFFADYDGSVEAGGINWNKYDCFIRDLAPKYGLKVLALLNVGMVAYEGKTVRTIAFNDPPDGGGSDPGDGSNHFIRVFTGRAQEIAARYGDSIAAYEVINEPNISYDMWV